MQYNTHFKGNKCIWLVHAGGACRAKIGAQCMLRCPREALRQRREQKAAAAGAAAAADEPPQDESPHAESLATESPLSMPQLSMRESISSVDDSQDGEVDLGQESTSKWLAFRCSRWHSSACYESNDQGALH